MSFQSQVYRENGPDGKRISKGEDYYCNPRCKHQAEIEWDMSLYIGSCRRKKLMNWRKADVELMMDISISTGEKLGRKKSV